jgi:hypothetical protein
MKQGKIYLAIVMVLLPAVSAVSNAKVTEQEQYRILAQKTA